MIKLLITGGRDYADYPTVENALNSAIEYFGNQIAICQGGAKGADSLAKRWAHENGIACFQCNANWDFYDKKAGMLCNQWMLTFFKPDYLVAFTGGVGTNGMIQIARKANIPVRLYGN